MTINAPTGKEKVPTLLSGSYHTEEEELRAELRNAEREGRTPQIDRFHAFTINTVAPELLTVNDNEAAPVNPGTKQPVAKELTPEEKLLIVKNRKSIKKPIKDIDTQVAYNLRHDGPEGIISPMDARADFIKFDEVTEENTGGVLSFDEDTEPTDENTNPNGGAEGDGSGMPQPGNTGDIEGNLKAQTQDPYNPDQTDNTDQTMPTSDVEASTGEPSDVPGSSNKPVDAPEQPVEDAPKDEQKKITVKKKD